ncbi:benzoate/H(+) symporter BenE family transporter [Paraconexibacter antarcticus]|uniref:Benzoate/H(+) symporter BenE family transporter n=1 Tax=Paraconexibacter antarcticus TaxID=2949664 RepID=A0ABY5DSJ0_9ACTN|nr:benzoate/H(+) symporter BenE family transporter [Paraconexibacter antarcticus]UTI63884.1 benzoate/H(+) symporter BenE family transporter [Paraconexibacter antarcticus]
MHAPGRREAADALQPALAGAVASVVGFAGAFTVVLTGLRGVGASERQAASGLLALCVGMGVVAIGLGLHERMPIAIAWSTPGAALLVTVGVPSAGWPAAVGAFLVAGALTVLAGLWRPLGRAIAAIPGPLASAMLAGVLLPICEAPARAVVDLPGQAVPVVLTWLVLLRVARPWAVPGALAAAAVAVATHGGFHVPAGGLLPHPDLTTPVFDAAAITGIALPLFIVTMASQNVTGMTVLASFGFRPPLRPILLSTGTASFLTAPFGGHGINVAAITAALSAGPDAHPDPARRWIASVTGGVVYLALGVGAGLATALVSSAPPVLVECVAGLALLGALGGALAAAVADPGLREAAVTTLVVSSSGITALKISAPFWGLLAGILFLVGQRVRAAPA